MHEGGDLSAGPGKLPGPLQPLGGYELSLQRAGPGGLEGIDLHWSLFTMRGPLPTLSGRDVLLNVASHAAKDDWNVLCAMADLERLAGLAAGVAHAHTGGPELLRLTDPATAAPAPVAGDGD